jgi:HYR domain
MDMNRKFFMLAFVACLGMVGLVPRTASAVPIVTIGNGQDTPGGSYLNAANIAFNLTFTPITIQAENEIVISEPINIGTSIFGIPQFNLTLIAPKIRILGNVTVSDLGHFFLTASQIDLAGSFYNLSGLLTQGSRFFGTATSVSVLNNNASLQQALDFTNQSFPSTVTAAFGTANSLAFNYNTNMILSGGLLSGTVTVNNVAARLQLIGHGFQLDTGSGFQAIGSGSIGPSSGQLKGVLTSGNPFTVSFTQGGSGQIGLVSTTPSVLDQANQSPSFAFGYSFFTREGSPILWMGQTVTSGITGQLTQVDLPIWRDPAFDTGIFMVVLNSSFGVLGSVTVASSLIPTGGALHAFPPPGTEPFSVSIDLSGLGINVVAGQSFVIAARSTALYPAAIPGNGILWLGSDGNPYGGGHEFLQYGAAVTNTSQSHFAGADLGFRTYVRAAPTDTTPPVLNLPTNIVVAAITPMGASVTYTVTATDNSGVTPTASCAPLSGVNFPIGTTTVNCTATDASGNSSTGSFTVTVKGSAEQLSSLIDTVGILSSPFGTTNSLATKLQNAVGAMQGGDVLSACNLLRAFINEARAQSGKKLTPAQASQLITSANQIRLVMGCP